MVQNWRTFNNSSGLPNTTRSLNLISGTGTLLNVAVEVLDHKAYFLGFITIEVWVACELDNLLWWRFKGDFTHFAKSLLKIIIIELAMTNFFSKGSKAKLFKKLTIIKTLFGLKE
uniref:Uncharacterized protein n=1 Tax=Nelumbo nucifera TaxID=4432 RepID=A0A822YC02_NELNU|nr:TPA_asm: hypothetical protein HUJ06_031120 [Nelumbo nucifera]